MHTASFITFLLPALSGLAAANPLIAQRSDRVSEIAANADKQGVQWQDIEGGRFVHLDARDVPAAPRSSLHEKRGWVSIGNIFGQPSKADCYGSGRKVDTKWLLEHSKDACAKLVQQTSAGKTIDTAWSIVTLTGLWDDDNEQTDIVAGVKLQNKKEDGKTYTPLTESLCNVVLETAFTGAPCSKTPATHGAKIQYGSEYEFQYDPNAA